MPKVSIGLPVYNGERYISEAIESILNQTFPDFELVISDNASTDRTYEIVRNYKKTDSRIHYHRNNSNMGAAYNYNRAFKLSSGEFFKWASYDDKIAPSFLESCLEALTREQEGVLCYPRTVLIDENGDEIKTYQDNLNLMQQTPHERFSCLVRKINLANPVFGLIRSQNLRKTRLIGQYVGSDYITLIELCLQGTFVEIPDFLFFRRDHSTNVRRYSVRERAEWWDPINPSYGNHRTRLIREMAKSVSRTNLPAREKGLCYLQVGSWHIRKLRATAGRHKATIKQLFNKQTS